MTMNLQTTGTTASQGTKPLVPKCFLFGGSLDTLFNPMTVVRTPLTYIEPAYAL